LLVDAGGRQSFKSVCTENICFARCDVGQDGAGRRLAGISAIAPYPMDFSQLYDAANDIDAVVVTTPEHTPPTAVCFRLAGFCNCE